MSVDPTDLDAKPLLAARKRFAKRERKLKAMIAHLRNPEVAAASKAKKKAYLKKANEASVEARGQIITIDLKLAHSLSGTAYGPGRVKVPQEVAQMLLETERRHDEVEAVFHGRRAMVVIPGGRTIQVAPEMFESTFANATPFHF